MNTIVINNIPITTKIEKLTKVIKKKIKSEKIVIPTLNNKSKGFAIAKIKNNEDVHEIIERLSKEQLIKGVNLSVYQVDLLNKFTPESKLANQLNWQREIYDQYIINTNSKSEIYWNNKLKDTPIIIREESSFFSPSGLYNITKHDTGFKLYYGDIFNYYYELKHENAWSISFSPKDTYAVTNNDKYIIWDIKLGIIIAKFNSKSNLHHNFLNIKWSSNEKYFGLIPYNLKTSNIVVYENKSNNCISNFKFELIKVNDLIDFNFCKKNSIVYWTKELQNIPAKICVMNLKNKTIHYTLISFRTRELNVLYNGYVLSVIMKQGEKMKHHMINYIKNDNKTTNFTNALNVIMEPYSYTRFIVQYKDRIELYDVELIKTIKKKNIKLIEFGPNGKVFILVTNIIEFWDFNEKIGECDHYDCKYMWSPCGRYLATYKNKLIIWSIYGDKLYNKQFSSDINFQWRPRYKVLNDNQLKNISKKKLSHGSKKSNKNKEYSMLMEKYTKEWNDFMKIKDDIHELMKKMNYENVIDLLFKG